MRGVPRKQHGVYVDDSVLLARIAELEVECASRYKAGYEAATRDGRIRIAEMEAENKDLRLDLDDVLKKREQAEAALVERDRQWTELRQQMQRTAKRGLDMYVRGNAKDFMKMMDAARAEEGSA